MEVKKSGKQKKAKDLEAGKTKVAEKVKGGGAQSKRDPPPRARARAM